MITTSLEFDRKACNTRSTNIETPHRQSYKAPYGDSSPSPDRLPTSRTVELREELPHDAAPLSQDVSGPHDLADPDDAWFARRVHRGSTESCQGAGGIAPQMGNEISAADFCSDRALFQTARTGLHDALAWPKQCQRLPRMPQLDRGSPSPLYSTVGSAQTPDRIHTPFDNHGCVGGWWPLDRREYHQTDPGVTEQSLFDTLCVSRHASGTWPSVKSAWNSLKDKLLTYIPPYLTSTADAVLASLLHTGIVLLAKFEAGEEDYMASKLYEERVTDFLVWPKSSELIDLVPEMCRALRTILTALVYASETYGHWFASAAVKVDQELECLDRYSDTLDDNDFEARRKFAHPAASHIDQIEEFYQKNLKEPIRSILPSLRAWYSSHIRTADQYQYWDKALWLQLMSIDFLAKAKLAIPFATVDTIATVTSVERRGICGHDSFTRGKSTIPEPGTPRFRGKSRSKSPAKRRTNTGSRQREGDTKDVTTRRRVQNKSSRSARKIKDPDSFLGMSGAEQTAFIQQQKEALALEVAAHQSTIQARKAKAVQDCKGRQRNKSRK